MNKGKGRVKSKKAINWKLGKHSVKAHGKSLTQGISPTGREAVNWSLGRRG